MRCPSVALIVFGVGDHGGSEDAKLYADLADNGLHFFAGAEGDVFIAVLDSQRALSVGVFEAIVLSLSPRQKSIHAGRRFCLASCLGS